MKTRFFVLLLAFGCGLGISAQETGFYPVLSAKVSPLSVLDPLTSTFAASLTFRPVPRLGLHFEYGWQYESLKLIDRNATSGLINDRYYELRPEIQYFISFWKKQEIYLALEGFYIPHTFSLKHSYIRINYQDIRFDAADGNRFTHGLVLKGGVQFVINEYFLLEAFSGFGYRRREINIYNLVNPREDFVHDHHFPAPYAQPGVKHRIHLTFGFRIGGVLARGKLRPAG